MATANTGQGKAGGLIMTPSNVGPFQTGVMHGKDIALPDAPKIDGGKQPYPPVKEVKLGVVNDQEF